MSNVWWIMRRELSSYFRTPTGYVIVAVVLAVEGFFFSGLAVGPGQKFSSEVLSEFFLYTSGLTLVASVFISMGLIAQERERGTMALLSTSPVKDYHLVLGKFLSALVFLGIATILTLYMPALVMINGKISLGQVVAGYFGVMLIGSAGLALGMLCSALAPNQLVAAISAGAVVTIFILLWALSKVASPPLDDLIAYLSLHDKHFRPFMQGLVRLQDVVFYVTLTYVALLISTRVLEARRWR